MSLRAKATVSSAITNGANTLIVSAQSIVLLPLFLRLVGKSLFGAWSGSGDVLLWMQAFDLGLPNLMAQRIAVANSAGDAKLVGRWLATSMVLLGGVSAMVVVIGFGLSITIPSWFGSLSPADSQKLSHAFLLASIGSGLVLWNNGLLVYARAVQRPNFLNAALTAGALLNFGVTLGMLLHGYGLMAIAAGVLARSLLQTAASLAFFAREARHALRGTLGFDRGILGETLRIMPATLVGGLAYAGLNQSEILLVGLTIGPIAAAGYLAIRRGSDLVRALADTISFSVYPSYAHLVGEGDQARSLAVYRELSSLRFAVSLILLAPYLAVNSSFIAVWVKGEVAPNRWLTVAIGAQIALIGGAFMANYMYRAAGELSLGSLYLALEAVVRVAAMWLGCRLIGLFGIPLGACLTSSVAWFLTERALRRRLGAPAHRGGIEIGVWVPRFVVVLGATALGLAVTRPSWSYVVTAGGLTAFVSLAILTVADPGMARLRARLRPGRFATPS